MNSTDLWPGRLGASGPEFTVDSSLDVTHRQRRKLGLRLCRLDFSADPELPRSGGRTQAGRSIFYSVVNHGISPKLKAVNTDGTRVFHLTCRFFRNGFGRGCRRTRNAPWRRGAACRNFVLPRRTTGVGGEAAYRRSMPVAEWLEGRRDLAHACNESGRQRRRPLLVLGVNWSVLETLIGAPPPGIRGSRTIFSYPLGAVDVVVGNRLCARHRRNNVRSGGAVAGRGGQVFVFSIRGCNRPDRDG